MTSHQASPVNDSAGALPVGGCFSSSIVISPLVLVVRGSAGAEDLLRYCHRGHGLRPSRVERQVGDHLDQLLLCAAARDQARDRDQAPVSRRQLRALPELAEQHCDGAANTTVALLRTEAGRDPYDKGLSDLVGQLSTRSEEFRVRWAAHNVRLHRVGSKHFRHPAVGELALNFEAMDLSADPGLTLTAYSAEPGTRPHDTLKLLASWAATLDQAEHDAPRSADWGAPARPATTATGTGEASKPGWPFWRRLTTCWPSG